MQNPSAPELYIAGHTFEHLGFIRLERQPDGSPVLDNPQEELAETERHKELTPPFCRLRLPKLPSTAGVYVVVTNGTPAYVGTAENLYKRWHSGYKKISRSNCKHNGQPTNTRVNHLILEARERGLKVGILFCRYDTLEQLAIAELSPPWNIQ